MKSLADRDLAVGHLARSERGFTDEEYKRYLSRIPKEMAIVELGYSEDVNEVEPILGKPLRVTGVEVEGGIRMLINPIQFRTRNQFLKN